MTAADDDTGMSGDRLDWALGAIREGSGRFAAVVERWGADGLDANVPSTPGWSVRDLAHHLGEVQRSWGENVRAGDRAAPWGGAVVMPADDFLVAWLHEGTADLCDALEAAGPAAPCWTWWGEPATSGAVARHQVQEAAVHCWDVEAVMAIPEPLGGDVADDGVGEFLEIVLGPGADALPGVVTLRSTDTGGSWEVAGRGGGGGSGRGRRSAEVRGTASDLVLMLYRRIPVSDCTVEGDPLLVASLLALAHTA
jgi:uncharacterized protein (TIGR03083 family)